MRYIILRKADADTEAGVMPGEDLLMAMGQYNESLQKAGVMLDGMGLHPSSTGARITFKNGKPIVTDGPFAETKELLAGFTVIQVKDRAEAIEWVKRWPAQDANGNVTLELRRVFEMEDFEDGPGLEKHRDVGNALNAAKLQVNPYLGFNGDCRAAFRYYEKHLGGVIEFLQTQGESPMADQLPVAQKNLVMHARLRLGNFVLMGGDAPADHYQRPQGMSVTLNIAQPEEAERVFNALADNGSVTMPLAQTFWARTFGMVTDQFGIPWMINCE